MPKLLSLVMSAGLAVYAANAVSQPLWETLNYQVINEFIIPKHQLFRDEAKDTQDAVENFCQHPEQQRLESVRNQFLKLNAAWMAIQHIRYGPVEEDQRHYRIQLYPDKRNAVGKHLAIQLKKADMAILEDSQFSRLSTALQGISALEHLLYSDKIPVDSFTNQNDSTSFPCALMNKIGQHIALLSQQLYDEWSSDDSAYNKYTNEKKFPLKGDIQEQALQARTEVTSRIYNGYYTQLYNIIEHKLMLPLSTNIAHAKPHLSESHLSQQSLVNIKNNLIALEEIYNITYGPLLEIKSEIDLHKKIKLAYEKARNDLNNIELPLSQAISDETQRAMVETFLSSMKHLHELSTQPMSEALVIPMHINTMDGD